MVLCFMRYAMLKLALLTVAGGGSPLGKSMREGASLSETRNHIRAGREWAGLRMVQDLCSKVT